MKYTTKQYASTLLSSLDGKTSKGQGEVIKKFLVVLQKNGDFAKRNQILKEAESQHFKKNGIHRVSVELASEIPANLEKEIEAALGKKIVFEAHKNKDILGGIKILVDDEILVDASARAQIARLFAKRS